MLKVLLHHNDKVIDNNDLFFSKYTIDKVAESSEQGRHLRSVILDLEPVEFVCSTLDMCRSTLTGDIIPISKMSTGIKTLMNILTYKDTVFNITECGKNISNRIFLLDEGFIYMAWPLGGPIYGTTVTGVLDDGVETSPMTILEMERWLDNDRKATGLL